MGVAIAAAAWRRGADVTSSPGRSSRAAGRRAHAVASRRRRRWPRAVERALPAPTCSSWRPRRPTFARRRRRRKIKKTATRRADRARADAGHSRWRRRPRAGRARSSSASRSRRTTPSRTRREKLEAKGLDLIVVNDATEPGAGFGVDTNRVTLLARDGDERAAAADGEDRSRRRDSRPRGGAARWTLENSCAAISSSAASWASGARARRHHASTRRCGSLARRGTRRAGRGERASAASARVSASASAPIARRDRRERFAPSATSRWRAAAPAADAQPPRQRQPNARQRRAAQRPAAATPSRRNVRRPASSARLVRVGDRAAARTRSTRSRRAVAACTRCPLYATAKNPVPGDGNPQRGPHVRRRSAGRERGRDGRPFVGAAGQLLTKILAAIDLQREDVFICNVLKHRPPGNRNPCRRRLPPAVRIWCARSS